MNDDVELSESEREALAGAKRPIAAPPAVENGIIAQLRSRGLLASRRARRLRWLTAAAALVAAFASGAAFQRTVVPPGAQGPRFLLLLYGGDPAAPGRRGEYGAWARSVAAAGVAITGEELSDAAEEIPSTPGRDGMPAATAPRGLFIVSAASLDEARRIAASCPHLRHGGRIVVRTIVAGS